MRNILHCDMNNFYASVECMLDPTLKKYPIAVCGSVEERHGIVLAKNYKAKAFDVKTGDAVWQAKQKCKDLVVVPPHYEEYIKYSDFIFINRFGQAQHQATLNKAIRRIIRDCNDEQFEKSEEPEVLLPHFSCHSLRHTFTTRMCEAGVNIKVIQDALGHTDISTTLNIYTDVTKELKTSEFKGLDNYFKAQ